MTEVEIKLPVSSLSKEKDALVKLGFISVSSIIEEDRYLDNECNAIRSGGKALRIRKVQNIITGANHSVITYKGEKLDRISMTRKELETPVSDGLIAEALLNELGYFAVEPIVRKNREQMEKEDIHACLDHVEGLGEFLELEIVTDAAADQALERLIVLLADLGHSMKETTRNSYLSMLQGRTDE